MICWTVDQAWNISQPVSENPDHLPVDHRAFRCSSWVHCTLSITGCALWLTVSCGIWVATIFQEGYKRPLKSKESLRPQWVFLAQQCICNGIVRGVQGDSKHNFLQKFILIFSPVQQKTIWQNLKLYCGASQGYIYISSLFWALPTHSWLRTTLVYS